VALRSTPWFRCGRELQKALQKGISVWHTAGHPIELWDVVAAGHVLSMRCREIAAAAGVIQMDVFEAIARRYSYRGAFQEVDIPRADLCRIVQAGIQAPSGCNAQTTSFVMVDDLRLMQRIAEVVGSPVVHNARAMIVCIADHRPVYKGKSFGVEDCAAAVENMLLAVTALGYATVWIDGALRIEGRAGRIADILEVPDEREVRILLPLGVPAEPGIQKEKLPFNERAWFNGYRNREAEQPS
jgi:nitroreductase